MKYANIKYNDVSNGPGVRVCLFVSGCSHKCKGCFNEIAWNYNYGSTFDSEVEDHLIESINKSYINGITFLGGEPLDPKNREQVLNIINRMQIDLPSKSIWCYTGYTYEDIKDLDIIKDIFQKIDVLVDGKFDIDLFEYGLKFRGSTNQRIIDIKETNKQNKVILWQDSL